MQTGKMVHAGIVVIFKHGLQWKHG